MATVKIWQLLLPHQRPELNLKAHNTDFINSNIEILPSFHCQVNGKAVWHDGLMAIIITAAYLTAADITLGRESSWMPSLRTSGNSPFGIWPVFSDTKGDQ
jgi:hypothetical protein